MQNSIAKMFSAVNLASITSKEENAFITGLLKEFNYSDAFIGGSDREKEGEWKWESGESWSYSNWGANQPDDYKACERRAGLFENWTGWSLGVISIVWLIFQERK